ncbi:MAG: nitroreductase family deazaflavin-dependent oxidoreductase, partial [Rhodococcus sp.]|nr:nitroreductase family deazaflavin-dependent oxidoreductase [Rhodococcus sp. (in: high G+C Gram-positive bacteria)]
LPISSGTTYRTPLDAYPVEGGYVFILVYGSGSDWVQNVLRAGSARLSVDETEVSLGTPRLVAKGEAFQALSSDVSEPPRLLRITEYLRMDLITA